MNQTANRHLKKHTIRRQSRLSEIQMQNRVTQDWMEKIKSEEAHKEAKLARGKFYTQLQR